MGKQYVVKFSAVGEHPQGTILDPGEAAYKNYDWPWLLKQGAIAEVGGAEQKADAAAALAQGGPAQSEAMALQQKAPVVGHDAPELSTGQPGGAPLSADAKKGNGR